MSGVDPGQDEVNTGGHTSLGMRQTSLSFDVP